MTMMVMVVTTVLCLLVGFVAAIYIFYYPPSWYRSSALANPKNRKRKKNITYAFFHPYASGGGGGERVLWKIIQFLQSNTNKHKQLRQQTGGEEQSSSYVVVDDDNDDNDEKSKDTSNKCDKCDDGIEIVIYTIDPVSTTKEDASLELRLDAERRFDVNIPYPVRLVSLEQYQDYLSPRPFLSLVMESWGTMKLAYQALLLVGPQQQQYNYQDQDFEFIFCDTTGCAFTFLVVRWIQIQMQIQKLFIRKRHSTAPNASQAATAATTTTRILAYVHYPTISVDMMMWEWQKGGSSSNNNNSNNGISIRSKLSSMAGRLKAVIKLVYYYLFSLMYGLCGSMADLVLVNSTWTYNHINSLFWQQQKNNRRPICIVYPPCRVPSSVTNDKNSNENESEDRQLSGDALLLSRLRENTIVSIGQFRPEKNHKLQIRALSVLLKKIRKHHSDVTRDNNDLHGTVKLLLIGSCRNAADRGRVEELRQLVIDLDLEQYVIFSINPPYKELQASMIRASCGIHTMRQEHFGIGIVEMMAAGLLVIAHNSGGPKSDIIHAQQQLPIGKGVNDDGSNSKKSISSTVRPTATGFLATTEEEYADAMYEALTMNPQQSYTMRQRAQISATRFSDDKFDTRLVEVLPLLYKDKSETKN